MKRTIHCDGKTWMFKIEVENDPGVWSDVRRATGRMVVFEAAEIARGRLAELHRVTVQMEIMTAEIKRASSAYPASMSRGSHGRR